MSARLVARISSRHAEERLEGEAAGVRSAALRQRYSFSLSAPVEGFRPLKIPIRIVADASVFS